MKVLCVFDYFYSDPVTGKAAKGRDAKVLDGVLTGDDLMGKLIEHVAISNFAQREKMKQDRKWAPLCGHQYIIMKDPEIVWYLPDNGRPLAK